MNFDFIFKSFFSVQAHVFSVSNLIRGTKESIEQKEDICTLFIQKFFYDSAYLILLAAI